MPFVESEKEASAVTKAKGLKRVAQLLTGSRAKALEGASAGRGWTQLRHRETADRLIHESFAGVNGLEKQFQRASYRTGDAQRGANRLMHAADRERTAVGQARSTAKKVGVGTTAGVGAGVALDHHLEGKPGKLRKEAFGTALMAGLKGISQFASTAGKSIGAAGKAGGLAAAGQAAGNAGRSGLMRAGNFIAQNPAAGATMVAAPALAAGYAATRQ